jgi:hypothetical protein
MRASSVTGAAGDGGLAVEPSDMLAGGARAGFGFQRHTLDRPCAE